MIPAPGDATEGGDVPAAAPGGSPTGRPVGVVAAADAALAARTGGRAVAVVVLAENDAPRRMLVYSAHESVGTLGGPALDTAARELGVELLASGGSAARVATLAGANVRLYGEAHRALETLYVVGAGHIAVPLARLGVLLGLRVVVLDDREEFATGARFPDAALVRRADFSDPFHDVEIGADDYVVLVTRAHRYDFDCLARLVRDDVSPRYIGMVGSRRRVRAAFGALLEAGVLRERLAAVHAPIGLDIGAETPEEIAVAIAAEIVATRRGAALGGSLRERERVLERLLK